MDYLHTLVNDICHLQNTDIYKMNFHDSSYISYLVREDIIVNKDTGHGAAASLSESVYCLSSAPPSPSRRTSPKDKSNRSSNQSWQEILIVFHKDHS